MEQMRYTYHDPEPRPKDERLIFHTILNQTFNKTSVYEFIFCYRNKNRTQRN